MYLPKPPLPTPQLPITEVYIDESSQQHRYLVLGAVTLPQTAAQGFIDKFWQARMPELPRNEMKWTKVSKAKLAAYTRLVDAFFDHPYRNVHFHALIVDTTKQRHGVFNQGSKEIGFNKELYQIIMKCGRLYPTLFHVYPDRRNTNQTPEDLRLMVNRGVKLKGDRRDWPFRRLQFRDSDKTELLQVADIFAGALAYRLNDHHSEFWASPAKTELSAHVMRKAQISDVFSDTSIRGKFTVWHRKLL